MRYFPMFLDMAGRTVVLAGGGEQVAQKARLLKRTEARLVIMSEELAPELAALVDAGRAAHVPEDLDPEALRGAAFVFVATEDEALDLEVADHARAAGALVNVVDTPDQCDMITPAIVDRDPIVAAIGTEGAAPVLAKAIKTQLEQALSPRLGGFVARLALYRDRIAAEVAEPARLAFWEWAARGAPWRRWRDGDEAGALAAIDEALTAGRPPEDAGGGVTVIETPAAADLLPLRAVERLQQAAVIFHAPGLDPAVLDLARRDALRRELPGCPRGDAGLGGIAEAARKGSVVAIGNAACAGEGVETIRAAPDRPGD